MDQPIKGLIVDPEVLFSQLIAKECENTEQFSEVMFAKCAAQAKELLQHQDYDVMILSLCLEDADAVSFAEDVINSKPDLRVIATYACCTEYLAHRLFGSSLDTFIDRSTSSLEQLRACLLATCGGRKASSEHSEQAKRRLNDSYKNVSNIFSRREIDVMCQIGKGCTNAEIGSMLCIAPDTVKWHLKQIASKLGLPNRAALIVYAYRNGFVG
jgi:DNA-binding NarL/FixJ family response regulator